MLLTTISPLLSLLLLTPSLTSAACSTFSPLPSSTNFTKLYLYDGSQTERLSNTLTCPSNASYCYVGDNNSPSPSILPDSNTPGFTILRTTIGGQVTTTRTIAVGQTADNGTTIAQWGHGGYIPSINGTLSNTSALWDLISASTDSTFPAEYTQNVAGSQGKAFEIHGGESGYFAYEPYVMCVRGVLSGCTNGGSYAVGADMAAIEACAPVRGEGSLSGSVVWQKAGDSREGVVGVASGASGKGRGAGVLALVVGVGVMVVGVM